MFFSKALVPITLDSSKYTKTLTTHNDLSLGMNKLIAYVFDKKVSSYYSYEISFIYPITYTSLPINPYKFLSF